MGHISFFDLEKLRKTYNANVFIETGTYLGDSVVEAAKANFKKIYSIEITPELVVKARKRFEHDPRIEIVEGSSSEVLKPLLDKINENVILWLDAHFPGYFKNYDEEPDKDKRAPLEKEVIVLKDRKSKYKDVILVDDLRCYEDNLPGIVSFNDHMRSIGQPHVTREKTIGTDSKFIYDAFCDTHEIEKYFTHEGYLSVLPKQPFLESFDKVVFFNHGHLGDTLIAKIFIKEIIKQLSGKKTAISNAYSYSYVKDIVDEHININHIPFNKDDTNSRSTEFLLKDRILYINSWFAPPCVQPSDHGEYEKFRIDLRGSDNIVYGYDLHLKCFQRILENINKKYQSDLSLAHMWLNKADFILDLFKEEVNLDSIPFLRDSSKKKILIFNQIATSGQSDNQNFSPYIDELIKNENIVVYTSLPNVNNHPRVINLLDYYSEPDLFKTANVSILCDFICGPSNATVISTWVKPNINRTNLTYIIINRNNVGEATLFKNMSCKVKVVSSTSQLFETLRGDLNG